jgi:hypothetical protein
MMKNTLGILATPTILNVENLTTQSLSQWAKKTDIAGPCDSGSFRLGEIL